MPPLPYPWLAALLLTSAAVAGPVDDAILAAMNLAEKPNYSWRATISDDLQTYDLHGQTRVGEFTRVTMPLAGDLRRQFGRRLREHELTMIFRGNVRCAIATEEGWKTADELPALTDHEIAELGTFAIPQIALGMGIRRGMSGFGHTPGGRSKLRAGTRGGLNEDSPGYSSLRLAVSHPHEELAIIVSSYADLRVNGNLVTGRLTDLGAQLLLVREGQADVEPVAATGSFQLWIHDGMVTKYHVEMEGVLSVEHELLEVRQSMTTVVNGVGTTKFEVPAEVRQKLGG